jgi:hypothetical protein
MYFRAKEYDIAKNYFEGTFKSFQEAESRLRSYFSRNEGIFEKYLLDMIRDVVFEEFRVVQIEVLIEATFFELTQGFLTKADDLIVRIYDMQDDLDAYLKNEVLNLVITSTHLRKTSKNHSESNLEVEMENLRLTPDSDPPKTPESKPIPPKITKNVVQKEELPAMKRKVIKLNLDDVEEKVEVKTKPRKKTESKIPVPVTTKAVLENITPRTRSKPEILVTNTDATPSADKNDFYTPISTPNDQFFTPMSSVKTYSKKSLRSNIVKNLEAEFSTPKTDKENSTLSTQAFSSQIPKTSRSTRSKVDRSGLKRATSPGKLSKERSTRK